MALQVTQQMIDDGTAKVVQVTMVTNPDQTTSVEIAAVGSIMNNPFLQLETLTQGVGLILSHIRQRGKMTQKQFTELVKACEKTMKKALIEKREK